ncbi:MAG: sodium:calcium antiporter [Candidatus Bathyarchaeota archaeon]|nr:MAG: sodium:calcium antiporter [Candidatus Bathyarchaeota archaeon]
MVLGVAFAVAVLVSGIILLTLSSDKAVEHSVHLARALRISSLMIGLILVSVGTDLPEMANSIVACSSGHGDIDVGDSLGSILTQITLVLGLIALFGRDFSVKRKEVLVIGFFEILALVLVISVAVTGFTRVKAFLMIVSWPIFLFLIRRIIGKDMAKRRQRRVVAPESMRKRQNFFHFGIAALSYVGVAIGALAVVQSVILLSSELGIPEFFISFFVVAIGTSLPELVVDLTAARKREYELVIGDIIGSCIVDATISISIGQLLFPTAVFVESPMRSILLAVYAIIGSAAVLLTLAIRKKVDKKSGVLFIMIYLTAYVWFYLV